MVKEPKMCPDGECEDNSPTGDFRTFKYIVDFKTWLIKFLDRRVTFQSK